MFRSFERRIATGFGVALLLMIAIGALSYRSAVELNRAASAAHDSHQVLTRVMSLLSIVIDAEARDRGFALTGDEEFLESPAQLARRVRTEVVALREHLHDDDQRQRLATLEPVLAEWLALSQRAAQARRTGTFDRTGSRSAALEDKRTHDRLRGIIDAMSRAESAAIVEDERHIRATAQTMRSVVVVGSFLAVVVVVAALIVTRREFIEHQRAAEALRETTVLQRAILDGAHYAIIVTNAQGVSLFNRGAERMLGYRADEIVGRQTVLIFHEAEEIQRRAGELSAELGERISPGFEVFAAKARRGGVDEREWTYRRKDGTRFPVQLAITALPGAGEGGPNFLGIAVDVTERKQAEEDLRQASARALDADRIKSAFLATMSHELRTPLNSIIGFTGIILQGLAGPLNPEQTKQLGMVQTSARHLLALINDVLDLSKIEARELKVSRRPFDLAMVIAGTLASVRPLAERKGLALRTSVAPEVGSVISDPRRVEQILLNLLSNAIKFTERGEVALTAAAAGSDIEIRVCDTGIGIKPQDMSALFRPFQQVDSGLARQHEGTGLGLAICRRLTEILGGRIQAESTWGRGSVFTFTLPREAAASPCQPTSS